MPLATPAAVTQPYSVLPVPKDLIPSTGIKQANILWIGCSDSWITETSALDVLPEETFVHRNLGNVMSNGDLSSESAVVYCVDLLKASHVIFFGNTS
jgi:carbonic anhydrase